MTGLRLYQRMTRKRDPLTAEALSERDLWGVILEDETAGAAVARKLSDPAMLLLTPTEFILTVSRVRGLAYAKAGVVLAVLLLHGRYYGPWPVADPERKREQHMTARRFAERLIDKRHPLEVESVSTSQLWAVVLNDRQAGHELGERVAELIDLEPPLFLHALEVLPLIGNARAARVLAALLLARFRVRESPLLTL